MKSDTDIKLAMDIMQCQYSMFTPDQFDISANSCISDWIVLALSPMGKFRYLFFCRKKKWHAYLTDNSRKGDMD
jgi:hypothetical protein